MVDVVKKLQYRGPAQQVCYSLTEHGYSPILVPDAVYELPTEFADALMASNGHFQVAPAFSLASGPARQGASTDSKESD